MAFIPINYEEGHLVNLPMTAATYTKGQALACASGRYLTAATAQEEEVFAVCMEAVVIGTTGNTALCITTRGPKFLADCDAAPTQTDVGTRCDMASGTTLDTNASDDDIFYIEGIEGTVGTSTQVIGYFMNANPNS